MISRELAEALLNTEGDSIKIISGTAAPDFPKELSNLELTPLGYAKLPGRSVSVLLSRDSDRSAVHSSLKSRLIGGGFTVRATPEYVGFVAREGESFVPYERADQSVLFSVSATDNGCVVRVMVGRRIEGMEDMRMRHMSRHASAPMP